MVWISVWPIISCKHVRAWESEFSPFATRTCAISKVDNLCVATLPIIASVTGYAVNLPLWSYTCIECILAFSSFVKKFSHIYLGKGYVVLKVNFHFFVKSSTFGWNWTVHMLWLGIIEYCIISCWNTKLYLWMHGPINIPHPCKMLTALIWQSGYSAIYTPLHLTVKSIS